MTELNSKTPEVSAEICSLHANALIGWVRSPEQPSKRWAIAVNIDGQQYSLAYADQFIEQSPGDGCHGFRVLIDDRTLNSAKSVTITLANSDDILDTLNLSPAMVDRSEKLMSRVIWQPGLCLHGWLVDKSEPSKPQQVYVFEGENKIASVRPNRWENIDGSYVEAGFLINLPFSLADGKQHTLKITNSNGQELQGSPIVVQEWPRGLQHLLQHPSEQSLALLSKQIDNYQRLLPSSVRMLDYKKWLEVYQPGYHLQSANAVVNTEATTKIIGKKGKGNKSSYIKTASAAASNKSIGIIWLGGLPNPLPHTVYAQIEHFSYQADDQSSYVDVLNQALNKVDWLIQLPVEIQLTKNALDRIAQHLDDSFVQVLYSDFSFTSSLNGFKRIQTAFLPAFDSDRLWQQDYLFGGGVCAVRSELIQSLSSMPLGLPAQPGSLSYALAYVIHFKQYEAFVMHLPEPLLHRHEHWPEYVTDANLQSREQYLSQVDDAMMLSRVLNSEHLSLTRQLKVYPDLTLIMPTRNGLKLVRKCLETFFELTDYPAHVTILIIDNQSDDSHAIDFFEEQESIGARSIGRGTAEVKVAKYPYPFNYSSINNFGVDLAETELIGLLNNDIEILHSDWLERMVALLQRNDTGIVGAKLLWPNGMVQHGGVIGGQYDGLAGHIGNEWHQDDDGYLGMNQVTQRFTMVTAACLLMRKADFLQVGGLDERAYPVAFNDVDLCLKIRRLNKAVVWTPNASLIHAESASRGKDDQPEKAARAQREQTQLRQSWLSALMQDPAYNPNLSLNLVNAPYTALALPPRERTLRNNQIWLKPIQLRKEEPNLEIQPSFVKEIP